MGTWAIIYHLRQAEGREQHIARRYIHDVPEDATTSDVRFSVDAAGQTPAEFGIEWANHSVIKLDEGQRLEERGEPETSTWIEIVQAGSTDRRVTLRMSPSLHRRVTTAAETASQSINTWCVEALERLLIDTASGDPNVKQIEAQFTERARRVLSLAQEEAQRFNHNYIGTEHLLLGLIRVEDGIAGRVLIRLGITLPKARDQVEYMIGRGDGLITGRAGMTPRAKKVLAFAMDEVRRLNNHYVGTEHLLLGLIREGEGIASGVIESLGVSQETVRLRTMQIITQTAPRHLLQPQPFTAVEDGAATPDAG